jgi:hypothetical protein
MHVDHQVLTVLQARTPVVDLITACRFGFQHDVAKPACHLVPHHHAGGLVRIDPPRFFEKPPEAVEANLPACEGKLRRHLPVAYFA